MADGLTVEDLADRAGAAPDDVRRLVELGIVLPPEEGDPWREGDVRRVRLAMACEAAGLSLEAIGRAVRDGKLSFAFLDLAGFRWAERLDRTYRDLAAEFGLPVELLLAMYEAVGMAPPAPDERAREDDLELLPIIAAARALGLEDSVLLGTLRVYGESLRRIAEAETAVYHTHIEMPLLRSGLGERQMMERATEIGSGMVPLLDRALLATYRRQQEHAWTADLIEHVESALEEAGLHHRLSTPPAMCFLDLTGYTRLTEERGDHAAFELADRLAGLVQHVSQRHGGRPVKWLGDGVMFHFREPAGGVRAALEMVERTAAAELPPAHVGMDAGPVVFQNGDYFGRTVNLASRIAGVAEPGQVLVTRGVREATADGVTFRSIGPLSLKGVARPIELFEARPA
ncbi:MAG TPA: adenylate/guanylate cyclase domain-containing protein [Actinomycetota bacterium]|nr:adenylate/guanylate cyclase domain-containing protein [Actinomycetota bacterium]